MPPGGEIEAAVREVYEHLHTYDPAGERTEKAAFKRLSRLLLGPAAGGLSASRWVIVADGALHYLPFGALPAPHDEDEAPLVLGHEIVYLPSASTLAAQRRQSAGRLPAQRRLAVLADPVFEAADPRVGGSTTTAATQAAPERGAARRLTRLPNSRKEAQAIASVVEGGKWTAEDAGPVE